jgi:hypothetical protein
MKTAISFSNVFASISQILGVVNQVVDTDTPVIISAIPGGVSANVSGDIVLGELGLAVVTQIIAAIGALHAANVATAPAKP